MYPTSPFKVILFYSLAACLGILFLFQLPVDLLPSREAPVLTVSFYLSDAPPEVVEQQATSPLENAVSQLSGLKKIYSVSSYGRGIIELTFDKHADIAQKRFELSSLIRQVHAKLNSRISYPQIAQQSREDKAQSPLLIYQVSAAMASFQLKEFTRRNLLSGISKHPGIREVVIQGAEEVQLTIRYDRKKLDYYQISTADIAHQLEVQFSTTYPGIILTASGESLTIKSGQPMHDIEQVESLRIRSRSGLIPLKTVAAVYWEERSPSRIFRINGSRSITVVIYADEQTNRLTLSKDIKLRMQKETKKLPPGFNITLSHDDSAFIQKEVDKNLYRSILSFTILIFFILVMYRKLVHLFVLFSGIVVSLGITALFAYLFNLKIHLYTIAGITISLGIILDNSIVVLDHISTRRNTKIIRAIIAASLITITSLLLVFTLPEQARVNLADFCVILALAIGASVLTAVVFTPALLSMLSTRVQVKTLTFKKRRYVTKGFIYYYSVIAFISRYRKTFLLTCVLAFGLPIFLLPSKLEGSELYNRTIGSALYQKTIRPYSDKLLGGTLQLFAENLVEHSGYREPVRTQLYIHAELPYGNTLGDMDRVLVQLEKYLAQISGVENYVTQIYSGQYGLISVSFTRASEKTALPHLLKTKLIAHSINWSGVQWTIYGVGEGFSNRSVEGETSFSVGLKGYNYEQLERYAREIADTLLQHKRVKNVNTNAKLNWNEKSADHLVLDFRNPRETGHAIRQVFEQADFPYPYLHLAYGNRDYPVFLQGSYGGISTHNLLATSVFLSDSIPQKLSAVAGLQKQRTVSSIHKENRLYVRNLDFDYNGSTEIGTQYLKGVLENSNATMAVGYSAKQNIYGYALPAVNRQYLILFIVIASAFLISAVLFEDLKKPLWIIFTIPLSFIGVFITFTLFNVYFDQGGYAAFILLGGLVVNASIYVTNDIHSVRNSLYNRAVAKAAFHKMRPITLTILSTCLGLLPFLFEGEHEVFWFSLATATIGGMIASAVAVFICLPIFLMRR